MLTDSGDDRPFYTVLAVRGNKMKKTASILSRVNKKFDLKVFFKYSKGDHGKLHHITYESHFPLKLSHNKV
jgi:hypothetical protein